MVIDIQRTVIKTQIRRFITMLLFVAVVIFVMLAGSLQQKYLGITKYQWAVVISIIYFGAAIFESFLNYNYIYFSDEGDRILLRYFSMSIFNTRKNSIEIPNKDFKGYTLEKKYGGLKEFLTLIQDFKGKDAKYPAVNITSLSRLQREKLIASLDNNISYATSLKF
jgi:hypothetical protein